MTLSTVCVWRFFTSPWLYSVAMVGSQGQGQAMFLLSKAFRSFAEVKELIFCLKGKKKVVKQKVITQIYFSIKQ